MNKNITARKLERAGTKARAPRSVPIAALAAFWVFACVVGSAGISLAWQLQIEKETPASGPRAGPGEPMATRVRFWAYPFQSLCFMNVRNGQSLQMSKPG